MMIHDRPGRAPVPAALLAACAALALAGCVSFGAKPPAELLTLSPARTVAPGTPLRQGAGATSLLVADPDAPKLLDTVRVPVQVTPTSVAYVKGAVWSDTPRHLFRKLLTETIAASGNRIVLEPGQYSAVPGQRLSGELIQFGVDAATGSAIVTFDAILTGGGDATIAKQRFTASAPVGKIEAASAGTALNAAANQVAADVAAWVGPAR
ncbi:MAG: ABC-type transport auxiliary lipoprotein family protein [Sphingobium sp.]|nr:ABC-type transport auxiliary lipoprotein family protein [Sphingobium sp.]